VFDTPAYRRFRRLVTWCVEWRKTTIAITLGIFGLGVFGFKFIEKQFFPDSSRPELMVEMWLPEGASFAANEAQAKKFEAFIAQAAGVESVTSYVGTGSPRFYLPLDQIFPQSNVAQVVVLPKHAGRARGAAPRSRGLQDRLPRSARPREAAAERAAGAVSGAVPGQPGRTSASVRGVADQVKDIMRANPNTVGVNDNWNESVKVLRLDLDQDKLRALGVTSQAVRAGGDDAVRHDDRPVPRGQPLIDIVVRQPARGALDHVGAERTPTSRPPPAGRCRCRRWRADFVWEPGVVWREGREWAIMVQSDVVDGIQGPTVSTPGRRPAGRAARETAGRLPHQAGRRGGRQRQGRSLDRGQRAAGAVHRLHAADAAAAQLLARAAGVPDRAAGRGRRGDGAAAAGPAVRLRRQPRRDRAVRHDHPQFGDPGRPDRAGHRGRRAHPWDAIVESAVRRCRPILLTAAAAALAMIPLSRSVFWGPMAVAIMGGCWWRRPDPAVPAGACMRRGSGSRNRWLYMQNDEAVE
jgi:multidrug efflux pump